MQQTSSYKDYHLRLRKKAGLLIILCLLLFSIPGKTQSPSGTELSNLVDSVKTFYENQAIEKLYLQLNKPEYAIGDTIWFKVYLLDAINLKYVQKSAIMYLEIASDSNEVVSRIMIPLQNGIGWGNITLTNKDFPEGSYTLRAYTNWMRNFGEDHVFKQHFRINSVSGRNWLVNSNMELARVNGQDKINLFMQFRDMKGSAMGLRDMQFRLTNGKRTLFKAEKESSLYGEVELSFDLPEKAGAESIRLIAENQRKNEISTKLLIPLPIRRPENTDLQFMPEGGHLVAGHLANIAFKAIAEDGKGTTVSGLILDQNQKELTSFSSTHRGMGKFRLMPIQGESYIARIKLPDGNTKDYPLPLVKSSGTTLKVINRRERDSLEVQILYSPNIPYSEVNFFITAQTNGMPYYGAAVVLKQGLNRILINKDVFPSGICRISLLNENRNPLNERLVFIDHQEELRIKLISDKTSYKPRDSISLAILVQDKQGRPVQGSFSLSVTDDNHVKRDSINEKNILNTLLLDADLNGNIEAPGYYFLSDQKDKAWADLDNLLLTQGWTGFNWPETLNQQKPLLFPAESEFSISGTVTNIFNKPVANSEVLLLSKKPFLFMDTLSNKEGRFTFRDFPLADTAVYMIQSRNKRGKSFNVGIEVDEFVPPVFTASNEAYVPWYINTDTLLIKSTRNTVHEQHRWDAPAGVNVLEEVVVTAKKFIKDSRNRNGPGNADYILDEQDMLKAKKKTLYEMLEERFPGFRSGKGLSVKDYNSTDTMRYVLMQSYVNLVIDGVNISSIGATEEIYMDYLTAEDITGIEILKTPKYASVYDPLVARKMIGCMRCPPPPIFLEITTRSGNGAFLKKTPGVYLYKPIPYSFPAEFYRPKYPVNKIESIADLRSAIHWEPNIITDAEGKATISFYAADLPGYYSIVLEGTDMNGGIGMGRKKIEVRK